MFKEHKRPPLGLLRSDPARQMKSRYVSDRVGNVRSNDPE